jgi:ribonuclease BN (tRNA processing enzyme)
MDVMMLPSTVGGGVGQYLSTWVVNGRLAVDAGCLGFHGTCPEQARIRDVLLTHSHIDHVASLPVFVDNVYGLGDDCPVIHATAPVLQSLREDVFNDRLMPNFLRLADVRPPFLRLTEVQPGVTFEVAGLRATAVAVDHPVPTVAWILEEPGCSVAFVTDTGPTQAIWDACRRTPHLKAVFLEATFPAADAWLAGISGHLTTELFRAELAKVPPGVPVIAVHQKPRHAEVIAAELAAMRLPNAEVVRPGRVYRFGVPA